MPDHHLKSKGRPFGGQCWLLDDSCELIDNYFFNKHSSYVHIKLKGQEIVIFGVYMPFLNKKKKNESISMYETTLSLILAHLNIFKEKNIPVFIVGDFNADPYRSPSPKDKLNSNILDKIFSNFIQDHNLSLLDMLNTQITPFTYHKPTKNSTYYANLDHAVILDPSNILKSIQCNIMDDVGNLSDHLAIRIDFSIHSLNNISETPSRPSTTHFEKIKFESQEVCEFYNSRLKLHLNSNCCNFIKIDNGTLDSQLHIDQFYKSISSSFTQASNETLEFQKNRLIDQYQPNNMTRLRKNNWFCKELKCIKEKLTSINKTRPASQALEKERKILKKEFRRILRQKLYIAELKEQAKID
jgi:hypothetical protein